MDHSSQLLTYICPYMDRRHAMLRRDARFVRDRPKFSGKDRVQLADFSVSFHEIQAEHFV